MARPVLVLDPGHGGRSRIGGSSPNNAMGPNRLLERDLTLDMARRLRALLANDFDVRLTRDNDSNLSLAERADAARRIAADSFISIHFNGDRDASVNGTEAWIAKAGRAERELLGQSLVDHVSHVAQIRDRGVKRRDLGVLKADRHAANTAACLLEVSFLSNAREADQLAQEGYKRALADAIATGVRGFFSGASLMPPALSHAAAAPGTGNAHAHCPALQSHAAGDNLALRWTGALASMSSIDLVVHLHGFVAKGSVLKLAHEEALSGVELGKRSRPTLGLVPLGMKTGKQSGDGSSDVIDFPALLRAQGAGLDDTTKWALDWFAANALGGQQPGSLGVARFILTAHSGGGARLQQLLAHHDPHELHLFDCLYQPTGPIESWVTRHIRQDATLLAGATTEQECVRLMDASGGALCCVWRGTGPFSKPLDKFIQKEIAAIPDAAVRSVLARYYRVVHSAVEHIDVARAYGELLLASAAADLSVARTKALEDEEPAPFVLPPLPASTLAAPGLADWGTLLSFRPSTVLQKSIRKRVSGIPVWAGWPIQVIEVKANGPINLDYYPVHVTRLPTVAGTRLAAEDLLERIRLDINSFLDTRFCSFEPYDDDEAKRWSGTSPEGTLIHIDMRMGSAVVNPDDGSVACTERTPNYFTFSTIWTPADLWHPVSGNRQFGFSKEADGTHVFFTRGADRVSGILDRAMSGTVFSGAHAVWLSLQQGIAKFVNDNAGDATIRTATSDRHDWSVVKAALHKPARTWLPII